MLGSTELLVDGQLVPLRPRERAVIAALALYGELGATTDDVAELVWGDDLPASASKTVHNHVRRVRSAVGPGVVETRDNRYRLGSSVDVDAREVAIELDAHGAITTARLAHVTAELGRWRGDPYEDLVALPVVAGERARLAGIRRALLAALGESRVALGHPDAAVAPLVELLDGDPYDERAWWLLALARYRAGQRRESLQVLGDARRRLVEVGMAPGKPLLELERLIVVDDPAVERASVLNGPQPTPAFVGRVTEQERVRRAVDAAHAAAMVVGEPGIGKTTLVRAVATTAAADGWVVLWGDCESEPMVPLAPIRQMLGALPAGSDRQRLFDDVAAAVDARRAGGQVLLIVDDAHLAGPTTLGLLAHIRSRVTGAAVLAVSRLAPAEMVRSALEGTGEVEVVEVTGFEVTEIGTWLDANVGHDRDPSWDAWLQQQTGGNPLLLAELVRVLDLRSRPPRENEPHVLPVAIQALLIDRLKDLTDGGRHAVQAASVLGMSFDVADLVDVLGNEHGVEEAERLGLLVPGARPGALRFAHALVQQAAYTSLSAGARIELHDCAGDVLAARGGAPGDIARHHLEAAELDPQRAVASARAAAGAAMEGYAYGEAAALFHRGIEVLLASGDDERVRCELEIEMGEALRRAGDRTQRTVLFDAADRAARLGEGDLLARAALSICNLGVNSEAGAAEQRIVDVVEQALAVAASPALRAELAGAASLALSLTGQAPRCRALYERAEAEARRLGDPALLGRVLPYAYLGLARPDDLDRRAFIAEELLAADDPVTVWEGHQLRFAVRLERADPSLDDDLAELHRLGELIGEPQRRWEIDYLDAARLHLAGDLDASEAAVTRCLDHGGAVADSRAMAVYGAQLIAIRAEQGRLPELLEVLTGFVDEQPGVAAWSAVQAWAAAAAGESSVAAEAFERCASDDFAAFADDFTRTGALTALALAAGMLGDGERAAAVYAELLPCGGRMSWVGSCSFGPIDAALAAAVAATGDRDAAQRHHAVADAVVARFRAR